ncbi:MAG TPA: M18 family aminopeptidase, partial [Haliea salexigens]|nr:M18 family aminopeptidase [Haliea salexigens]
MHVDEFNRELLAFLAAATTPFHAVEALVTRLQAAGFTPLPAEQAWPLKAGGRYYLTRNDSSLIAFTVGTECPPEVGVRMVGAHTDSPCLMVKPTPEKRRAGYFQL